MGHLVIKLQQSGCILQPEPLLSCLSAYVDVVTVSCDRFSEAVTLRPALRGLDHFGKTLVLEAVLCAGLPTVLDQYEVQHQGEKQCLEADLEQT